MAAPLTIRIRSETEDAERGLDRVKTRAGAVRSAFEGIGTVAHSAGSAVAGFANSFVENFGPEALEAIKSGLKGLAVDVMESSTAISGMKEVIENMREGAAGGMGEGIDARLREKGLDSLDDKSAGLRGFGRRIGRGLTNMATGDLSEFSLAPLVGGPMAAQDVAMGAVRDKNAADAEKALQVLEGIKEAVERANEMDEQEGDKFLDAYYDSLGDLSQ